MVTGMSNEMLFDPINADVPVVSAPITQLYLRSKNRVDGSANRKVQR